MAAIFAGGIILFAALAAFLRKNTTYRLTREAVLETKGLLGKGEYVFPLKEIDSVMVQQNPIDRLFDIGTVVLKFKQGGTEKLKGIKDPDVVFRKIEALL